MLVVQARSEMRMRWRIPAFSVTIVALPVLFFTFFGLPYVKQTLPNGINLGAYLIASFAAYSVGSVMVFGFGIGVATERGLKVDVLMRATPLPPVIAIAAKVVNALAYALLSLVVLLVWVYYSAQILLLGAEFTEVYQIESDFKAKVEAQFNKMIESVSVVQTVSGA